MLQFRTCGEGGLASAAFDPAPLDISDPSFAALAASGNLRRGPLGESHRPVRSSRVRDIYLNDPALQQIYPLGLLPLGQKNFLGWLISHGRRDQQLTDSEILDFLHQSAEDELNALALTYLLQPSWQYQFPDALTHAGWDKFRDWVQVTYGGHLHRALPTTFPFETSAERRGFGVNLLSHFCNPSGIQQAGFWAKTALERAGLRTSCRDVPVPRRVAPSDRADWLGQEIYPVTILNQAATPYFECGYERSGLLPREAVYRVAYWNWELETIPDEWVKAAQLVDEIWSPTEFVARAMRSRMPCPVYHISPGVEIGPFEPIARAQLDIPQDDFVFLFMFDLHSQLHRKNPLGVYQAFRAAFRADDKVTLVLKSSGGDIHTAELNYLRETINGPKVILLDELMTRARAYGLIAMSDCFVSLHRSEGFGLCLAEAMLLAKPVIATGYSGNLDFMNRENSLLVDYELVDIREDRPIYTRGNFWAEPSIRHAASLMRDVYEHPDVARARAARAQLNVQELLSLETAGKRMRTRLERVRKSAPSNSNQE